MPRVIIGGATPAKRNWFASQTRALRIHGTPVELSVNGDVIGTGSGTTFFDVTNQPTSATITRPISVQTITIDLFKNGFETDPNAP